MVPDFTSSPSFRSTAPATFARSSRRYTRPGASWSASAVAAFGVVRLVPGDEAFMNGISLKIHSILDQMGGFSKCADINADTGRGPNWKTGLGAWVSEMIRIPRSNSVKSGEGHSLDTIGLVPKTGGGSRPEWGLFDERHSRVLSSVYIKS